ncbi:MAG: response regulator with CheY-like receiver domain and winged-helix DNA-binding domain [Microgenomates group bacterium Gr01-1014_80]|nr:MAG: response regulator with CheY-like receiver domain and winged-helix DNA-binding domain [Microgenomates group bacterium Gr01-1014_80]
MNPQQQKILLVEDEALIRELYTRQLTKAGFVVKPAATGEEAVQILKTDNFDVILLDIMLPGINGLQVLREYKLAQPNSPTVVVLLTNLGQESIIKEGFDLGAQAYLIKTSYTPDQIVAEVQSIIAGKPSGGTPPPVPPAAT